MLLELERGDILRLAHRHIVYYSSHRRASTVWAYGIFWITLLTTFVAAAGGLSALRSRTLGLILGLAAAALGALATALQYGKDKNLEEQHKAAADSYRQSYESFRIGLTEIVRARRSSAELVAARLDKIQATSPRVSNWPLAKSAARREVKRLAADLDKSIDAVEQATNDADVQRMD